MTVADRLDEVVRTEGARLLATLVRSVGDWSLAEDAVQEAAIAALRDWEVNGLPDHPRAWLTATARRKAIDIVRRESIRTNKERAAVELIGLNQPNDPPESVVRDDLLRLIFTCCHPSLSPEAQLALALRTLCQLPVPQIAAALLTSEAAMTKRLTRTRSKIVTARIPYRVPAEAELPQRLVVVCGVIHTLYTCGHAPLDASVVADVDLCKEGLRLARLLVDLLPDEPMPATVLSLILLTEARRPARVDELGQAVLLPDQDRSRWDQAMLAEGALRLTRSLWRTGGIADPYQLQAAIAYEHGRAPSYGETDWAEIVRLYDLLTSVAPSPPAALARAVALAERDGTEAGLSALAGVPPTPRRDEIRTELLARARREPAR